ncbi:hypothetical protein [Pseudoalteromonas aurantia]|uniref:Uncharacterized protein n=1 Tax=Pseudoalteromonas aurantia TaxID=43654 RepID=A0A5S3VAT7_9GAMM|nr:hypothetical protein [Pseudoalteromonas aurantia]TMO69056.1 hypothetical protein CWC19_06365 [Pseudoalteromonas aurantia]
MNKSRVILDDYKLAQVAFMILCVSFISSPFLSYSQERLNAQLPESCVNYIYAASEKHQACFPGAIANGQKGTAAGHRNYAIKQFYALNWPLRENERGVPEYNAELGQYKDNISVWQSWKTIDDIYNLSVGSSKEWKDITPEIPQECINEFQKVTDWPLVLYRSKTPEGFELFDKNNMSVYYQTYFNKKSFDTIVQRGLYTRARA